MLGILWAENTFPAKLCCLKRTPGSDPPHGWARHSQSHLSGLVRDSSGEFSAASGKQVQELGRESSLTDLLYVIITVS